MKSEVSRQKAESLSEPQVRAMRDMVYGLPSSDNNWEACRENWMRTHSAEWLEEMLARDLAALEVKS